MAIDTAQERFSAMTLGVFPIPPIVQPAGSIERYSMMWLYSGLAFSSPVTRIYEPFTLIFAALSTNELVYAAYSASELTFDGYSTNDLTFEG